MDRERVSSLYGAHYAEVYDSLWQEHPVWGAEAEHHVRTITELLPDDGRWLDVGCGTGWFLSRFPGVPRAGLDISPAMLERARAANPDAITFREGDIRDDVPEWHDGWDLVTSTGQAWSYVDSIDQIEAVVANLAAWTSPDGVLMVQAADISDVTGLELPLDLTRGDPAPGTVVVTGVVWSFYDAAGAHENMIWPSVSEWVHWVSSHFSIVEVAQWPLDEHLPHPRRVVIGRGKRQPGDTAPAQVVVHPVPPPTVEADPVAGEGPGEEPTPMPDLDAAPSPAAEREQGSDAPPHDEALSPEVASPVPGQRLPGVGLRHQPLSYLVGRVRPTSPGFWRAVRRRMSGVSRR